MSRPRKFVAKVEITIPKFLTVNATSKDDAKRIAKARAERTFPGGHAVVQQLRYVREGSPVITSFPVDR